MGAMKTIYEARIWNPLLTGSDEETTAMRRYWAWMERQTKWKLHEDQWRAGLPAAVDEEAPF